MKRDPGCDTILLALRAQRFITIVALQQGNGSPKYLQIIASATARARVDFQVGESFAKVVPELQQPCDVVVFSNTLPVGTIERSPVGERVEIEILPVEVDAVFLDPVAD